MLPKGKELIINIKSSWGDNHYVGLNGVEVFSSSGELVKISDVRKFVSNLYENKVNLKLTFARISFGNRQKKNIINVKVHKQVLKSWVAKKKY